MGREVAVQFGIADQPALCAWRAGWVWRRRCRDDRLALRVPDLTSAGLTFKSVQRLRFNNKPLVQIVYLPQNGPPIALCVMKDTKPDQPVATKTVDAMDVATWRQAELSYALIGKSGNVDLAALGKRISNFDMAPLFSDASPIDRPTSG